MNRNPQPVEELRGTNLRYIARLAYTGYAVAAFERHSDCVRFVDKRNREYSRPDGAAVYDMLDIDPDRKVMCVAAEPTPVDLPTTPEEDEAFDAMQPLSTTAASAT